MQSLKRRSKKKIITINSRSPTLDTVFMIEETIKSHSGEYNKTQIWKKLPRKVMWQTFKIVINYLESINKIIIGKKGILVYIWSPKLAKKYMNLKGVKYERK
jgi:hypothetical protein